MVKNYCVFLLSFFSTGIILSQDTVPRSVMGKNAVFVELGGNAFFYSINYERFFIKNQKKLINARIGLSYIPNEHIILPILMNSLIGGKRHKLELGVGATSIINLNFRERNIWQQDEANFGYHASPYPPFIRVLPTINAGYRYQTVNTWYLKLNFVLFLDFIHNDEIIFPWGGIGVGKYIN